MNDIKLVGPVEVLRDEIGHWYHPDLPNCEGTDEAGPDAPKWKEWLASQRLEVSRFDLEDEDDSHPVHQSYWEGADPNITDWNPAPEGDGWFLLAIGDTEDGPMAWFARRVTPPEAT